ncbi:MAG: hypothetical protein RTV31_03535 [Candidatus Thorarchaeota archaeon]
MKGNTEKPAYSVPKARLRKRDIVVIGVLICFGIYGIVQMVEYHYNPGGTIVLNPGEYQDWFLPDSHPLDVQRPRWKGVTNQDTFSVYFGPSAVIGDLITNFTEGLPLDAFSEYLLAEEIYYFNNYITIPSAGNWSIIVINPHTYAISVENDLIGIVYPYNLWMTAGIGILVGGYAIIYIKNYRLIEQPVHEPH